jgi:hypothetical protein
VLSLDVNPLIKEPQFSHFRATPDIRQPRETSVPSELAFQLGQTYPIPAGIRSDLKIAFVRQSERSHREQLYRPLSIWHDEYSI